MTKKHPTPAVNSLTLEQAHELIYKLLDRITELEDRLNQHSGNSSKPPSSDGPGSAPPARQHPASGKKRGAQPGHKGQLRERHPPDARLSVVSYYPPADCPCCGGKVLAHDKPYRVHQVFDLPEVSYFVTEHQLFRATCAQCINTTTVTLPETVSGSQMGANLLSYISLQSGQFRQRILSLVETAKRLGRCPEEWLRAVVRACIEKTDYPIPVELCASSPGG